MPPCVQELSLEEYEKLLAEKKAALNKTSEVKAVSMDDFKGMKVGGLALHGDGVRACTFQSCSSRSWSSTGTAAGAARNGPVPTPC